MAVSKVDAANQIENTLPVAQGGTGITSGFKNGITDLDIWTTTVLKDNFTTLGLNDTTQDATVARFTGGSFTKIGDGMSTNNSYWTFPSTGYWEVRLILSLTADSNAAQRYIFARIDFTEDTGSNWTNNFALTREQIANVGSGEADYTTPTCKAFIKINDTSTDKIRFFCQMASASGNTDLDASTTTLRTHMTFMKVGDI